MNILRTTGPTLLAAALIAIGASPAAAQHAAPPLTGAMVQQPTPDADALASEMRVLAGDPKNFEALLGAGELTLKLGDPTAAAVLFSRAEKVNPTSGRLKADEAAVLVHMERPGEALRLFQQAEQMGADPASFAAERGLAYDLIGEQERAQRDYRLALAHDPDNEETIRRYALSLGISGKRKQALAEIDPLVRKQDHAGWRDRAFILAMNGDADEADTIARGMLPAGMADELAPFFRELAGLSPTDRAFAVHFGELNATPMRLADARMAPPLPPLGPDTTLEQQLAAAEPAPAPARSEKRREEHKPKHLKPGRTAYSTAAAAAPQPGFSAEPASKADKPVQLAAANTPIPVTVKTVPAPAPATIAPAALPVSTSKPGPAASPAQPTPAPAAPAAKTVAQPAAARPASRVGEEDRILHNIISHITVPGSELGVQPMPGETQPVEPAAAAPSPTPTTVDPAAEAKRLEAANLAAVRKAAEEKAAAEAKAEAARKAAAEKKAAAAKKAADEKAAAEKRAREKAERANPSRIWVQVAGGANEGDLAKAWARVKAKAPIAFKGKQGWSTPLNATNRVLAGPFKSDDAAQDFVNALAKEGVSAFPFTSADGQKIDKLPAK